MNDMAISILVSLDTSIQLFKVATQYTIARKEKIKYILLLPYSMYTSD